MKLLELSDAVSMAGNGMQTFTREISSQGTIANSGITLEFLGNDETVFVTCKVGDTKSHLLLTKEGRLPFGDSRQTLMSSGFEFLFAEDELSIFQKQLSFDLKDEDNATDYERRNYFYDSYVENPAKDLFDKRDLECRLTLYYPTKVGVENVDGLAVLEFGNNLNKNSGLIYYYNIRNIPELEVSYL